MQDSDEEEKSFDKQNSSKADTLAKKYPEIKNNVKALELVANLNTITAQQVQQLVNLLQLKCPLKSTFRIYTSDVGYKCQSGRSGWCLKTLGDVFAGCPHKECFNTMGNPKQMCSQLCVECAFHR